jgi:hypothetical protein
MLINLVFATVLGSFGDFVQSYLKRLTQIVIFCHRRKGNFGWKEESFPFEGQSFHRPLYCLSNKKKMLNKMGVYSDNQLFSFWRRRIGGSVWEEGVGGCWGSDESRKERGNPELLDLY